MAGRFEVMKLGSVASVRSGYAFKSDDMGDLGHPIIKIKNVIPPRVDLCSCDRIPERVLSNIPNMDRYILYPGDIVIAMTGATVGKVGRFPKTDGKYYLNQRVGKVYLTDPIHADYEYLYCVLSHEPNVHRMLNIADGSAQANISGAQIENLDIPLPPLPEQRAIAHILGTLDDKIELNRRMNETLEAMARAIFKSWFVDFDPVRWNMQRKGSSVPADCPLNPELLALFPDSFEDSELGEIPKGWKVGTVDSLCQSISSGGTPTRMNASYWHSGSIPWFKTGELLDGPLLDSEEKITPEALKCSSCKLWPAGTILFALYASPTVGRLGVLTKPATSNQAAAGLIAYPNVGVPFLLNALFMARVKLQQIAVGAAQQNINQGVLKSHQLVIPPVSLMSTFSSMLAPFLEKQTQLAINNCKLTDIRDTLLPKLISGELRVADAERMVGGCV